MKYKDYYARDFANDNFFIRWVKKPDEESTWFWESFIKENPSSKEEIEKAIELVSLFDFHVESPTDEELARTRNRLFMALHAEKEEARNQVPVKTSRAMPTAETWLKVAAVIIIIPLALMAVDRSLNRSDDSVSALKPAPPDGVEIRANPVGQKSILLLDDGTKVWLNTASKISYAQNFNRRRTREVYLEGEAFFDVAHNTGKPFIVHASSIKIKVLGTSFNVKSYSEEATIETTLVQGKVRIEQSDVAGNRIGDIELKPNQCAVFNKESKVMKIKEVVGDNSASWKQERMVFDEEPMDNVILRMERWYNVKIHVKNKGKLNCSLTATIEKESLEDVLKMIATSFGISYRITGSNVYIEEVLCETNEDQ